MHAVFVAILLNIQYDIKLCLYYTICTTLYHVSYTLSSYLSVELTLAGDELKKTPAPFQDKSKPIQTYQV